MERLDGLVPKKTGDAIRLPKRELRHEAKDRNMLP